MHKSYAVLAAVIFTYSSLVSQNIHQLITDGKTDSVKLVLNEKPELKDVKNAEGKAPLHLALEKGRDSIAEILITAGADINLGTNFNTTPLHFAAFYNRLELAKMLLHKGADCNTKNQQNFTALHFAAWGGHKGMAGLLLEQGAGLEPVDFQNRTPLLSAVQMGKSGVAELLILKGANIQATDLNGSTVFHHACENGLIKIVEPYFSDKKVILKPDHFGRNPLYLAIAGGFKDIVYPILRIIRPPAGFTTADGNTYLHAAALGGLDSVAALLIKNGNDVNTKNVFGSTALHIAVTQQSKAMVELLLKSGAEVNSKTPAGETAWHIAKAKGDTGILSILAMHHTDTSAYRFITVQGNYLDMTKPAMRPVLFAPGIVSTPDFNERDITWDKTQTDMYFTRWPMNTLWNVMRMRMENKAWTEPRPVSYSKNYLFAEACFSPDDQRLYFISNRPLSGEGPAAAWEMWCADKTDSEWAKPQWLGEQFTGCFYPTFATDGTMYFTDKNTDLYHAEWKNGRFSQITKLSDSVNTPQAEFNACIAPDGSYIIFTSYGRGEGYGRDDLYISFRKKDDSWTTPKNMGPAINTFAKEYCPSVSRDGKYLFFSSSRLGTEDIYWVNTKIIDDLQNN
jgi:ankyrin repeat protein